MRLRTVQLGDISAVGAGQGAPQDRNAFSSRGHPFIRAASLDALCDDGSFKSLERINESEAKKHRLRLYVPDTVIFAKSGMSATKNRIYRLSRPAYVVNHLATVSPSEQLDSVYLRYWLEHFNPTRLIQDIAYPSISLEAIESVSLSLPDLSEQKRIAKLLEQADQLRRIRRYALELSNSFLPAAFLKFFGDRETAAKRYPVKYLEEVVQQGRGVTYGIVQAGPHVPDGVPYIKTGDIIDGVIHADGLSQTSREIASSYRRSEVKFGDLVMSIRATVGTIAVLPKELDGANLTQGTARIAPGPEVEKLFLLWQIRMPEAQRWITQQVKGSTFFEITLTRLREMPVFLPPLLKQRQFAVLTERFERLRTEQLEALRQADHLFQCLLHQAFAVTS